MLSEYMFLPEFTRNIMFVVSPSVFHLGISQLSMSVSLHFSISICNYFYVYVSMSVCFVSLT